MRVAHVNFAKGFRGGERQTLNLIEGLAELGVNQTLICRGGSELERLANVRSIPAMAVSHPLFGHVRPPYADIIHVHEARGAYWAAIEHALRNTRYVITRRVPNPLSQSGITAGVYRHATTLLGVSQDVSNKLSSQTGRAVQTILSATTALSTDPDLVREIRKMIGGGPIIGHVGALIDHHKGQSVLIEAFHHLLKEYPQARLVLVGEGPDRAHFERLARGDKRIIFAGFQHEIGSWTAAMDVFSFPSREEGLGSSVLDAMGLGIPVVVSKVGGLPELIGPEERGWLVSDHDPVNWARSIRNVLFDAIARNRRVGTARQFALENSVAAMAKSYKMLYDDILSPMQRLIECDDRKAA